MCEEEDNDGDDVWTLAWVLYPVSISRSIMED